VLGGVVFCQTHLQKKKCILWYSIIYENIYYIFIYKELSPETKMDNEAFVLNKRLDTESNVILDILSMKWWDERVEKIDAMQPFPVSQYSGRKFKVSADRMRQMQERGIVYHKALEDVPYSLCLVSADSDEARAITNLLQLDHIKLPATNKLCSILRVQNNDLHYRFRSFLDVYPPKDYRKEIRLLYHGTQRVEQWDFILSQGIRPELCRAAFFGKGTYFASDIGVSFQFSDAFYNDDFSRAYSAIGLFMCYVGDTKENMNPQMNPEEIPYGYGSFGELNTKTSSKNEIPEVFVLQDTRRAYPAYILIFHIN